MRGPECVCFCECVEGTHPVWLSNWIHSQEVEGHRIHQCHVLNCVHISMLNTTLHKFTPALEGYHHRYHSETTQGQVSLSPSLSVKLVQFFTMYNLEHFGKNKMLIWLFLFCTFLVGKRKVCINNTYAFQGTSNILFVQWEDSLPSIPLILSKRVN